jgi:transposase
MAQSGRPRATPTFSSLEERALLFDWSQDPPGGSAALALRCRIVIACADGYDDEWVAERRGVSPARVAKWRRRYVAQGPAGLFDKARSGAPRTISDQRSLALIAKTLEERPPEGTRWTTRSMARASGLSQSSVARIWTRYGLDPRQVDIFSLSADPEFVAKVHAVVGVYLNPPQGAVVLGVEKPAPVGEQGSIGDAGPHHPILPRPKTAKRPISDQPGDLHRALEESAGRVITDPTLAKETERDRDFWFRRFLQLVELSVRGEVELHVVVDHSSMKMTDALVRLLDEHRRFTLHTVPTYDWWMYVVEWWFAELADRVSGPSTGELVGSINDWLEKWNETPSRFVWVAAHP